MIYVNFVCTGNTCRSPMAEMMLKYELKQLDLGRKVRVRSSGTLAAHGDPINPSSKAALKVLGIPIAKFVSKPYSYKEGEIVICLTASHKRALPYYCNPVTLAELAGGEDIPDPFGQSPEVYLATAKSIQEKVKAYAKQLAGRE